MDAKSNLWEPNPGGLFRWLSGHEAWALTDQAVLSGTNFLTNVLLARFLGLREFGVFALAWMAVLFVSSLQSALIVAPMMSVGPQQTKEQRPFYFAAVVVQELVLAVSSLLLLYLALQTLDAFFFHANLRRLALPLATAAFAYQLQDFVRRYFFATRQSRRALANDALSYLSQLPLLLLLRATGALNCATALWALSGTSLLGAAAGWFWMEPLAFQWSWIKSTFLRHWKFSRWLGASALLQWTSGNLFVLAAPLFYGPAAAGVLKASQNLMAVAHIWLQGLDNVLPVEAAHRLRQSGMRSMLSYLRAMLLKWGGLTLLLAIGIGTAPGFWLRLFYGPQMVQYGYVLRFYALLYVVVFLGGPLRAGLQALEYTAPIFWSYLAMTSLAFVGAVPLTRQFGLNGTLLGLLLTQLLFQSIVAAALILRAKRTGPQKTSAPQPSFLAE
jgi:O-antigen/teichoic acid export membrane protein